MPDKNDYSRRRLLAATIKFGKRKNPRKDGTRSAATMDLLKELQPVTGADLEAKGGELKHIQFDMKNDLGDFVIKDPKPEPKAKPAAKPAANKKAAGKKAA